MKYTTHHSLQLVLPLLAFSTIASSLFGDSRAAAADDQQLDMLPGVMQAWQAVDLSLPVTGTIREIPVSEMQAVPAGALLVALDDRLAQAALAAAEAVQSREATIRRANLNVALAQKYLARVRDAYENDAASALELDEAEGRLEEALASLDQTREQQREAETQVALERVRLEGHQLRAPFPGQVTRIHGRPGAISTPSEPLLRLVNLAVLRASLHVPLDYFGRLEVGQVYPLWAELPVPRRVDAELVAQEPVIDAATGTFRCVFQIDNCDLDLPSGFAVRICDLTIQDAHPDGAP